MPCVSFPTKRVKQNEASFITPDEGREQNCMDVRFAHPFERVKKNILLKSVLKRN